MFTIAPPLFCILSVAYLIQDIVPKRSVWICSNQSVNKPGLNICALFIKMSMPPYVLIVESIKLLISVSLLMSAEKKFACPPCFLIWSTVSSPPFSLISDTTTCSPSLAKLFCDSSSAARASRTSYDYNFSVSHFGRRLNLLLTLPAVEFKIFSADCVPRSFSGAGAVVRCAIC